MDNALTFALAPAAGLLLGVMFYGGLWWTVRKALTSTHPALWFLSSMLLRTILALVGFYLVSAGRWERLMMCLGGFIVARFIVTRVTARGDANQPVQLPVTPEGEESCI
jgi:F1F0 ATPase subunit 2